MYELFKAKHPNEKLSYEFYRSYFLTNVPLRFGRPQVDVCSRCEELNTKLKNLSINSSEFTRIEEALAEHKEEAKKFYEQIRNIKKKCKNDRGVVALCSVTSNTGSGDILQ